MRTLLISALILCTLCTSSLYPRHGSGGAFFGGAVLGTGIGLLASSANRHHRDRDKNREIVYVQPQPTQDTYSQQKMYDLERKNQELKAELAHHKESKRLSELHEQKVNLEAELAEARASSKQSINI